MSSERLLACLQNRQVVICAGGGGVGKTTVSAALGLALASRSARRVLVLTIDPARRLATALGMPDIGTRPVPVTARALAGAGLGAAGELHVAMLDARSEWDLVIERHAPSRAVHDRIVANPFYRGISYAFAGSQEYVALEALYRLHTGGEYDCLVVDTPPSRDALAFLEAPDRLSDFVGARVISWLAGPSRIGWRAINLAAAPFLRMADRLLGSDVLHDLAEFVNDLQTLYGGVQERAAAIGALLRSRSAAFVVVTTLEPQAFAEAGYFSKQIVAHRMPLEAIVVNRVLPAELGAPSALPLATRLVEDDTLPPWFSSLLSEPVSASGIRRVGEAYVALHALARVQAAQVERLRELPHAEVVRLPLARRDISDLRGLGELALLLGAAGPAPDVAGSPPGPPRPGARRTPPAGP